MSDHRQLNVLARYRMDEVLSSSLNARPDTRVTLIAHGLHLLEQPDRIAKLHFVDRARDARQQENLCGCSFSRFHGEPCWWNSMQRPTIAPA